LKKKKSPRSPNAGGGGIPKWKKQKKIESKSKQNKDTPPKQSKGVGRRSTMKKKNTMSWKKKQ
jgi:hypothetical protein